MGGVVHEPGIVVGVDIGPFGGVGCGRQNIDHFDVVWGEGAEGEEVE